MTSPMTPAVVQSIRDAVGDHPMRTHTDHDLLRRFLDRRDESAFEAIVHRHGPMVLDVCRGMLPDADADDAFQATFLVLAGRAAGVRKASSLASWLHGVAFRTARKAWQRFARRRKHEMRVARPAAVEAGDDLTWREVRRVVHEELALLAEPLRSALVACYLEGQSQDEAAAHLDLPKGTLKGRLERGRALLRERLTKRGLGPVAALLVAGWPAMAMSATLVSQAVQGGMSHAPAAGKFKLTLAAILVVGVVAATGAYFMRPESQPHPSETKRAAAPAPREDPLPDGAVARLGTLRFRHGYELRAAVFGPADAVLFTAGSDSTVRAWDMVSGKELAGLSGHKGKVNSLALSPDGKLLASASDDRSIVFWDAGMRKELRRIEGHRGAVARVVFAPDSKTIASAGADESVRLWDVASGREVRRLILPGARKTEPIASLSFTPDGKALACGFAGAVGGPAAQVRTWQVDTGQELRQFDECSWHAFVSGDRLMTASHDHLRLWNLATGGKLRDFPVQGMERDPATMFAKGWTPEPAAAVSPDGALVAAVTREYTDARWAAQIVRVWDVATGQLKYAVGQTPYAIHAVVFSRDGKSLAVAPADGGINLFDAATGKPRDVAPPGHHGAVRRVAFTPDGKQVVSGGNDFTCRLWDAATGAEIRRFDHRDMVMDLALSPDGRTLVVGVGSSVNTPNESLFVWDVGTGMLRGKFRLETDKPAPIFRYAAAHAVAFAPDGKTFAVAVYDEKVRVWDAAALRELRQFSAGQNIFSLGYTPDGKALVGTGHKRAVVLWDSATGRELRRHSDAASFALSPDGRLLAAADGKEVRVHEMITGKQRLRLPAKAENLAFSADGRWLAAHGESRKVKVWDAATGREARELVGHTGWVDGAAFSPRGLRLATGSWDSTVLVWDLAGGLEQRPGAQPAEGRDQLWEALADADPAAAQRAMSQIVSAGAVAFLRERLKPAPADPVREKRVRQWIADLNSDRFAEREKATAGLRAMGEAAESYLREALQGDPSLERRRRLRALVVDLERGGPTAGRLRELRAVELLERLDSPEARRVLDALAGGDAASGLTREAKSALGRLDRGQH